MRKIIHCLTCGSRDCRPFCKGRDRLHLIPGEFSLVECRNCKMIRVDPQPTSKEIARYYPDDYHAYIPYSPNGRKEKFALTLYRIFYSEEQMKRQMIRTSLMRLVFLPFKHLLRGTRIKKGAKILDVGCGNGAFLYKMKQAGMDAYGAELSAEGTKAAKKLGLKVRQGTVEQQKYPSGFFDVITLNHVFEHVHNPKETIKELKRILKKDGVLIMAVPNNASLARYMFGKYWGSLDVPRHLNTFSPKTMRILAKEAGLQVKKIRFISFPFQFQASITYAISGDRKIRPEKTAIGGSRIIYWMLFPFVYLVDIFHIGDVIEVYFKK